MHDAFLAPSLWLNEQVAAFLIFTNRKAESNHTKVGALMTRPGSRHKRRIRLDCAHRRGNCMKGVLVLVAVIALPALSASQTTKPGSTHHRRADDPRCSQLRFQSTSALPSYNAPGFSTVSNLNPDEPFIVPAGCSQFSCARQGEAYRVLTCPNLIVKSFSRTMDSNGSPSSTPTVSSVPGSK